MAYSTDKLKNSGDKTSPGFRKFRIGKLSDECLRIRTLLYVWFKRILVSLSSFMDNPNSVRIFYNTSLLTKSEDFLKSTNSWGPLSLYSHFFSNIWRMQKSDRHFTFYVETHTDDPNKFIHLYVDITLRDWYGIEFCTNLISVISHDNYYSQFYHSDCGLAE
jgi:hypothetical protein